MTNEEKFREVFEKTFGFSPEHCFPCPEKCPEEFINSSCCDSCPYAGLGKKEYKQPEAETKENPSELNLKIAKIAVDLGNVLSEHSPVPVEDAAGYLCVFMDTLTGDELPLDYDLMITRSEMAENFFKDWPHSAEYYKRYRKEKRNDC